MLGFVCSGKREGHNNRQYNKKLFDHLSPVEIPDTADRVSNNVPSGFKYFGLTLEMV